MFVQVPNVLLRDFAADLGSLQVFLASLLESLGVKRRGELDATGLEHLHADIESNSHALFLLWHHVVRDNEPLYQLPVPGEKNEVSRRGQRRCCDDTYKGLYSMRL